jgi:hypothetical protein
MNSVPADPPAATRRPAAGMDNLPPVQRITVLVPVALASLVLAGCGGGADQTARVRSTLAQFGAAIAAKDYTTVCQNLLAPNLTAQMTAINLPCEAALASGFGRAVKPTLTVESIKVTGQSALAGVHTAAANQKPKDTTIGLVEVGSSWRIASLTAPTTAKSR